MLYGINILKPEEINLARYKILIASSFYTEIVEQLKQLDLRFYDNYLPYDIFEYDEIKFRDIVAYSNDSTYIFNKLLGNKKMAIIYGNCQTELIKDYLKCNLSFNEEWMFLCLPKIHEFSNEDIDDLYKNKEIFNRCELFLTQNISNNNKFNRLLSTDNIINLLKPNTNIVRIPNLFFYVYFPQVSHEITKDKTLYDIFPYRDRALDELALKKLSVNEILRIVLDDSFYTKDYLDNIKRTCINDICERDTKCDVKISDYILRHYKEKQLFYSRNHPVNFLIEELSRRILQYLGYGRKMQKGTELIPELSLFQEFIYPSVIKNSGLKFKKMSYMDGENEIGDLTSKIKKYLSYYHNII